MINFIKEEIDKLKENIQHDILLLQEERIQLANDSYYKPKYKILNSLIDAIMFINFEIKKLESYSLLIKSIFDDETIETLEYILTTYFYQFDNKEEISEAIIEAKIEYQRFLNSSYSSRKDEYDIKKKTLHKKLDSLINEDEATIIVNIPKHPNVIFKELIGSIYAGELSYPINKKEYKLNKDGLQQIIDEITNGEIKKLPISVETYLEERAIFLYKKSNS